MPIGESRVARGVDAPPPCRPLRRDQHRSGGDTLLAGELADQVALHSLLQRLGSLGLPILEVRRLDRALDHESDRPARMSCGPGATIQQDELSGGDR